MTVTAKEPSRLQRDLADRILTLARQENMVAGQKLSEHRLAKALNVSRTPIRAALQHLRRHGLADWSAGAGYALRKPPQEIEALTEPPGPDPTDALIVAIARDRLDARLPDQISEADLLRRYAVARPLLLRALSKLAELGLAARNSGYGWRFAAARLDAQAGIESYRYRLLIEPAGLLEPTFHLPAGWIAAMRRAHQATLADPWRPGDSVAFFEMNAAFHEGLAAASGNRFILAGVQQQNRLRRFDNYYWTFGVDRVVASSTEHLAILDALEDGALEAASRLLREHIGGAARVTRRASR